MEEQNPSIESTQPLDMPPDNYHEKKFPSRRLILLAIGGIITLFLILGGVFAYFQMAAPPETETEEIEAEPQSNTLTFPTATEEVAIEVQETKISPTQSTTRPTVTTAPVATATAAPQAPTDTPVPPTATPQPPDTTAPTLEVTGPANGSTINFNNFCFPMMPKDDRSKYPELVVQYRFNGSNWSGWGTEVSPCYNNVADGTYTFEAQAKDPSGNLSSIFYSQFTVKME